MDILKRPKFDDDLFDDADYPRGPDSAHDLRIQGTKSPERTPVSKLKPIRVAASSTSQSVDSKKPPKGKPRKPELVKIKHKVTMPSINIAFGNPSISKKEALIASNNTVISINAANALGSVYRSKNTLYKMNNTTIATNVTITSKIPPTPVLKSMNSSAAEMSSLMSRYTNADGSSIYQMLKKGPETSAEEKQRYHTRVMDSPNNTSYYESVDLDYNPGASFASSWSSSSAVAAPQPPSSESIASSSAAFPKRLHRFKKSSNQPSTGNEIVDEPHMMDIMTHIKPRAAMEADEEGRDAQEGNQQPENGAAAAVDSSTSSSSRPSSKRRPRDGLSFNDEDDGEEEEEEEQGELLDNFDETAAHHEEVPLVSRRASVNPFFNKSTLPHPTSSSSGGSHHNSAESLGTVGSGVGVDDADGFATGLDPSVHLGDKDSLLMAEIALHSLWDGDHLNSHFIHSSGPSGVHSSSAAAAAPPAHGSSVSSEDSKAIHHTNKSHHHSHDHPSVPQSAATTSAAPSAAPAAVTSVPAGRSPSPPPRSMSPTLKVPAAVSVVIPEIRPEADSPKSMQRKHHPASINNASPAGQTGSSPGKKQGQGSPSRSHAFLRNNLIKAYNLPMLKLESLTERETRMESVSSRDTGASPRSNKDTALSAYQSVSARDSVESRILPNSVKTRIVIPSHTTNDPSAASNSDASKRVRIQDPKKPHLPATQAVANRILRKPGGNNKTNSMIVTDYYDMLKGSRQVASTAVQILKDHTHPPTLSDTIAASETLQSVTGQETPASTAPHPIGRELGAVITGGGVGGSLKQLLHVTSLDLDIDNASLSGSATFRPHASNASMTKEGHYIQIKTKQAAAADKYRTTTNNPVDSELSSFAAGVSSYESFLANSGGRNSADKEAGGGAHKFIKIVAPAALDEDEAELMASEYVLRPSTQHGPKGVQGGASVLDDSYDSSLEDEEGSPLRSPSLVAPPAPLASTTEGVPALNPLSVIADEANAAVLTQYEYEEILDFSEVYFIGHDKYLKIQPHILIPELFLLSDQRTAEEGEGAEGTLTDEAVALEGEKIHLRSENRVISGVYNDAINGIFNNGFDNEDTTYIATKGDHVGYRYELLSSLGKGSFGDVFECLDHKTGKNVAVKIIKSKARFQEQGAHELAMLDYVKPSGHREIRVQHPASYYTHSYHKEEPGLISAEKYPLINSLIVQYTDSFMFRNHRCFVFPLYSVNLYEYMKMKDFAGLPISFIKKVAIQLLEALKYLRSVGVVHCDLKPENILLTDEKTVSIVMIDFGSACKVNEYKYLYIQSRFYRAPEVLMGIPYGFPIDMWSLACILPELRTSYPAFPGESERDQVAVIAEVLGEPPYSMYTQCTKKKELYNEFYKLVLYISPLGRDRALNSRTMSGLINARAQDQLFVSFLASILQWLPEKRLTPSDALRHPWLLDKFEGSSMFDSDATFQSLAKGVSAVTDSLLGSADILLKDENSSSEKRKEKSDLEKMEEFIEVFKFDYPLDNEEEEYEDATRVLLGGGGVVHNAAEIAEGAGVELMQTISEEEEGEAGMGSPGPEAAAASTTVVGGKAAL